MDLNNEPLVRSLGSQDANQTREVNFSDEYEWMKNKFGRLVPIALHLVNDKLKRGFVRTDGVVHKDDPADRVVAPYVESNPTKAMAMMAEQLAKSSEAQTAVVKELAKGRKKAKKEDVNEEVAEA